MTLCNKAEFAKLHGVSKVSVQKWGAKGWIVFSEGKVDVEASNAQLKKYRDSTDPRSKRGAKKHGEEESKPVNQAVNQVVNQPGAVPADQPPWPFPPGVIDPDESPAQAAERIVRSMGADLSLEEARRVKENYLALLNKLDYEHKSGAMVEMDVARSVLFDAFRNVRDVWMNWPTNCAALIAADLGLDAGRVTEVLTAYVHKQIASLGEPEGRFTKG